MLPSNFVEVCRLCLIKDEVEVNIFENGSKEIYYRISTCLPVTITLDDKLPKKICISCLNKVNMIYDFWNQTLDAEKHLLSWLNSESHLSNSFEKPPQTCSFSAISETRDGSTNNHHTGLDSDENNVESDLESNVERCGNNVISKECDESDIPKSNQVLSVDYQDDKPGPSGFQVEQTSALKQLQGLGEELIYLYVESEEQEINESTSPIEKYYQRTANQLDLLFDDNFDQRSIVEIEENNKIDFGKPNTKQSSYSVEFPKNERFDNAKQSKKRFSKKIDSTGNIIYSCQVCDATFSIKSDYHKHELIHFVDYPYECTFCDCHFKRYKQLENHKMYHHSEDLFGGHDSDDTNVIKIEESRYSKAAEKQCSEIYDDEWYCVAKTLPDDLNNEGSDEECFRSGIFSLQNTQKMNSRKRCIEDVHVCESCGQKFSSFNSHKCSKSKTVSE